MLERLFCQGWLPDDALVFAHWQRSRCGDRGDDPDLVRLRNLVRPFPSAALAKPQAVRLLVMEGRSVAHQGHTKPSVQGGCRQAGSQAFGAVCDGGKGVLPGGGPCDVVGQQLLDFAAG